MRKPGLLIVLLSLVLSYSLGACTSTNDSPADVNPTGSESSVSIDAKSILDSSCTTCHSLNKLSGEQRDVSGWTSVVKEMDKKGNIGLSNAEITALSEYLAETYK